MIRLNLINARDTAEASLKYGKQQAQVMTPTNPSEHSYGLINDVRKGDFSLIKKDGYLPFLVRATSDGYVDDICYMKSTGPSYEPGVRYWTFDYEIIKEMPKLEATKLDMFFKRKSISCFRAYLYPIYDSELAEGFHVADILKYLLEYNAPTFEGEWDKGHEAGE